MRDYETIKGLLRGIAAGFRAKGNVHASKTCDDAADAIDELLAEVKHWELEAAANETDRNYLIDENRKLVNSLMNFRVPTWISVDDELPEEVPVDDERWSISVRPSADVNIYLPSEGAIVTAFYSWADGTWITVNEDRIYSASEVLFWSKLPAPPTEEDPE